MTCVPESYVITSYYAFFQSIIRYGLIIWGNGSKISDILILQKKAILVITKSETLEHCRPLFIKLQLLTVINLYIFDLVSYMLKTVESQTLSSDVHNYNTRNKNCIAIAQCRLSKTQQSHTIMSQKLMNKVIHLLDKYQINTFKNRFYDWLTKNPFYDLAEFICLKEINF